MLILAAFLAGIIVGGSWRWLRGLATEWAEFDGYDPVEHPPPRVMPQIWDRHDRKETT